MGNRVMGNTKRLETLRARIARVILVSGVAVVGGVVSAQGWTLASNLTLKADLTLKETYDDNVYILDAKPDPAITPPVTDAAIRAPKKESFVTAFTPGLTLNYAPCPAFAATVSYAPEFAWYHSAHSEDYVAHRGAINFSGKIDKVTYEWLNSVTWIDGSHLGPVTLRPGDCAAIGGIPLRDRRDGAAFRDSLKVTIPTGKWFFRPVVSSYVHDFQTEQRASATPNQYIYDNFIDRWDVNGGLDLGYEAFAKTKLGVGYRYGHQEQGKRLGVASLYSSDYQRFLVGIEGTPAPWLKLAVLAGPDVRDWCSDTPAGFDRDELLYWVDGTVTLLPTKADTVTFRATRYEQPAFTSQSVYEDIKYDLAWRHKFSGRFIAGAGFTFYIGDWQSPVDREDWILTPSVMASYAFNAHLIGEAAWSYDSAESQVHNNPRAPYAEGREFTRNLVSFGLKYTF
jgi:hypothetical protein